MRHAAVLLLILAACGGSKPPDSNGFLEVQVFADGPQPGARVVLLDARDGTALGPAALTDVHGVARFLLPSLTRVTVKVSGSGLSYPPPGVVAPDVEIARSETRTVEAWLGPGNGSSGASVSGSVNDVRGPAAGVLVVASGSSSAVAGLSDSTGAFNLVGVPAGSVQLQAFHLGSGTDAPLATTAPASKVSLLLRDSTSTASGNLQFDGPTSGDVTVALADPSTGELVPGLVTRTATNTFLISHVPPGRYLVVPSPDSDGFVATPGPPALIDVHAASTQPTAHLIEAVDLVQPTNPQDTLTPARATAAPILQWNAYPGAETYVPEVLDGSGRNLWGGFDSQNQPRITTTAAEPFATYGQGEAGPPLVRGRLYRLRVWALHNGSIRSVSEPSRGFFTVSP